MIGLIHRTYLFVLPSLPFPSLPFNLINYTAVASSDRMLRDDCRPAVVDFVNHTLFENQNLSGHRKELR